MKNSAFKYVAKAMTLMLLLGSCSSDEGLPQWDTRYTVDNFPIYNVREFKDGKKQERIIYELKDQPAKIIKMYKHAKCPYYYVTWSDVEYDGKYDSEQLPQINEKSFAITKADFDRFKIPLDAEDIIISAYVTNLGRLCYPSLIDVGFWPPETYIYYHPNTEIAHELWRRVRVEIKSYVTDMKLR
jgi:hypothetical protein